MLTYFFWILPSFFRGMFRWILDGTPEEVSSRRGEEDGKIGRRTTGMVTHELPSFRSRNTMAGPTAACLEFPGD
jgi:hypothetical protein